MRHTQLFLILSIYNLLLAFSPCAYALGDGSAGGKSVNYLPVDDMAPGLVIVFENDNETESETDTESSGHEVSEEYDSATEELAAEFLGDALASEYRGDVPSAAEELPLLVEAPVYQPQDTLNTAIPEQRELRITDPILPSGLVLAAQVLFAYTIWVLLTTSQT